MKNRKFENKEWVHLSDGGVSFLRNQWCPWALLCLFLVFVAPPSLLFDLLLFHEGWWSALDVPPLVVPCWNLILLGRCWFAPNSFVEENAFEASPGSHGDELHASLELERDLGDHLLLGHNIIEVVLMSFGDESFHLPWLGGGSFCLPFPFSRGFSDLRCHQWLWKNKKNYAFTTPNLEGLLVLEQKKKEESRRRRNRGDGGGFVFRPRGV